MSAVASGDASADYAQPLACPACRHAVSAHVGRWCRVPTGAVNAAGQALICCCEAVDVSAPIPHSMCTQPGDERRWVVHVHGPDDLVLYDTEAEARACEAVIEDLTRQGRLFRLSPNEYPTVSAHVIPPAVLAVGALGQCGGCSSAVCIVDGVCAVTGAAR